LADIHNARYGGGYIVDVGANVGDTLAAIIKHTTDTVVCVEPVPEYYNLLQENINKMGPKYSSRVAAINAFVGHEDSGNYSFLKEHGTAHMIKTDRESAIPTVSLVNGLKYCGVTVAEVDLIKVDTDGFDAQCIMSLGAELERFNPVLFWEMLIEKDEQYKSYNSLISYLNSSGYQVFFIFDNYGNMLIKTDADGVRNINEYVLRFQHGNSARTFFYTDILAVKDDIPAYETVIREYLSNYC